nr:YnbE family lipoprotein [Microbulbifer celer]
MFLGAIALSACTPTVAVQAPSEPITVNLNVKIEHEIRVKVDKELDNLFEDKEGIF